MGRQIGPHTVFEHNAYFSSLNRGKRSVRLDLASEEGQASWGSWRPPPRRCSPPAALGDQELGLTYEALKKWNPKIVCVALTGYGLTGPQAEMPAYDYVVQALTGFMYLSGEPQSPPFGSVIPSRTTRRG